MKPEDILWLMMPPNIKFTRGARQGLLVDFSGRRTLQIPMGVTFILSELHKPKSLIQIKQKFYEHWKTVFDYLSFLVENRWLITKQSEDKLQRYCVEGAISLTHIEKVKLKELTLEIPMIYDFCLLESILEISRRQFGCKQISFLISKRKLKDEDLVAMEHILSITHRLTFHKRTIVINEEGMDSKSLFQLNSILPKYYFKKEAMQSKVISDPRVFPIDVKTYCFLNDFNQSIRSIFIDDSGTIYPSSQDKSIRLGKFRKADEFEKIVENRIHLPYAQLTKNKINKCRVCEYRKICTNTLCHRESYEQLESSPTNCLYNP